MFCLRLPAIVHSRNPLQTRERFVKSKKPEQTNQMMHLVSSPGGVVEVLQAAFIYVMDKAGLRVNARMSEGQHGPMTRPEALP
jgi:hypothetical protein